VHPRGRDTKEPAVTPGHQQALSHPDVDGRIGVARGEGKVGDKTFFALRLGARLADMFPDAWPRLDKIEHCLDTVAAPPRKAIPAIRARRAPPMMRRPQRAA
jgi:hypothetical protein